MLNDKKIKTMKTLQVIDRIGTIVRNNVFITGLLFFAFLIAKLIFKF